LPRSSTTVVDVAVVLLARLGGPCEGTAAPRSIGIAAMEDPIEQEFMIANEILFNSGIEVTLRVVHVEDLGYYCDPMTGEEAVGRA
jgi:hypothetical protein